jgi:uncharacterized protein (TIGR00369 family)
MKQWEDDHYCIACGKENPVGMKLEFTPTEEGLETRYVFPKVFQGYKDTVHGGMIALLLDEIMVNLPLRKSRIPAVSININVRLRKPLMVGEPVTASAFYVKQGTKSFVIKGRLVRDKDNALIAESEATCLRVEAESIIL